ncbi:MAG: 16S rRNA (guanine(527)-N(7))-methyltransferase RsmG [Bryobacteraceae bacterium]
MFASLLREKLGGRVELSAAQFGALQMHFELLTRWNKVLNLTAIRAEEEAVERHYCESVFLALHLPPGPLRIADVGSGGGFPGFPVGVVRPDCAVTLIESHQRKSVFLREATRDLKNFRVLSSRAEDVDEEFDRVISRAVSYEDLIPSLKYLGVAADLLTGEELPPDDLGFVWKQPISLPWGKQRFLRLGERRRH